jgi:hypothetical protein
MARVEHMVRSADGVRLMPQAPPSAYETFSVHRPLATHWRPATCAEVACPDYLNGWKARVEQLTEKGLYAATHCGRKFDRVAVAPGETWLVYDAGQPCFHAKQHCKPLERPELFVVRAGDWRDPGNPFKISPESWLDSFGENQEQLHDRQVRG